MSSDYQLPEGYVNPVPEPGEKKPKPWAGRSLPKMGMSIGEPLAKGLAGLVAVVFIFGGTIMDIAGDPIREAVDSAEQWAGVDELLTDAGEVTLDDSSVTAKYTPGSNEEVSKDEYSGTTFSGSQWSLTQGSETIMLRDYNFDHSPVKDRNETAGYYAASAKDVNQRAGHEVDIDPVTVDGRRGMVWRSPVDGGGWLLQAEFPGDPSTVRLMCSAKSETSVVATQCEEVLASLQFGE